MKLEPTWAQVAEDTLEYLSKVWKTVRPVTEVQKLCAIWISLQVLTWHPVRACVIFCLYVIFFDNGPVENSDKSNGDDPKA